MNVRVTILLSNERCGNFCIFVLLLLSRFQKWSFAFGIEVDCVIFLIEFQVHRSYVSLKLRWNKTVFYKSIAIVNKMVPLHNLFMKCCALVFENIVLLLTLK